MEHRLLVLFAETPIHAGGSGAMSSIDLPIQREAGTGLPLIWGQSLKGALRDHARSSGFTSEQDEAIFGSKPPGETDSRLTRGAVSFGDAQLLAMPAASLDRLFAWVTSVQLLARLARKARIIGADTSTLKSVYTKSINGGIGTEGWKGKQVFGPILVSVSTENAVRNLGNSLSKFVFPCNEEFTFSRKKIEEDVVIVEAGDFSELANHGTDVVARIQLEEETKQVAHGPFYSEYLPAETILVSVLSGEKKHLDLLEKILNGKVFQLGGDESTGKGIFWCRIHKAEDIEKIFSTNQGAEPRPAVPEQETGSATAQAKPKPVPKPGAGRQGGTGSAKREYRWLA
ncbi:MAG: type III-B CRISPR module RAMP protein Cmr4 [Mycobacteriaceae bacterium]